MPKKKEEISKVKPKIIKKRTATKKAEAKSEAKTTPRVESLAMVHHVHNTKAKKKFISFPGHFLRLDAYLATNPTLWQISWSILWRGFALVQLTKFVFVIVSSLLMAFFTNTIFTALLNYK
jgi:hypothetical protein